jgi:ATP-binding cassette subfamily B protein
MIERIDGDVNALANFFSQFVLLLVANALFLAGMLVLIAREQWVIGLALAAFTTPTLGIAGVDLQLKRDANGCG